MADVLCITRLYHNGELSSIESYYGEPITEENIANPSHLHTSEVEPKNFYEDTEYYLEALPQHKRELYHKLSKISDKFSIVALRYIRCQSENVFHKDIAYSDLDKLGFAKNPQDFWSWYSQLPEDKHKEISKLLSLVPHTCDLRFCDNPICIGHRNKKVIDRYTPLFKIFYNPNPHGSPNLRSIVLTSNLEPTPEYLDLFRNEVNKFLRKMKQIRLAVGGIHIHQSKLHINLVVYSSYIIARMMTRLWTKQTGWTDTSIERIRGGLAGLTGHLTKYIAKPFDIKEDTDKAVNLITSFYKRRLILTYKTKAWMKLLPELPSPERVRISPLFINYKGKMLELVILNTRNNSDNKTSENVAFRTGLHENQLYLEHEEADYG